MRPHLIQKAQSLDDSVVQVDEFRFAEFIDVDFLHDCYTSLLREPRPCAGMALGHFKIERKSRTRNLVLTSNANPPRPRVFQ